MPRGKDPSFFTLEDTPLEPVQRVRNGDVAPRGIIPTALVSQWENFDAQIVSKWSQTRSGTIGALVTTTRDQTVTTPGFSLGNGTIVAKYLKNGRFVIVKVRFTIGSTTKINGLVLDQSSSPGETFGETGIMHMVLPFPSASSNPYSYGTYGYSDTAVASSGALSHTAQVAFSNLDLLAANVTDVALGTLWQATAGSPTTYSANTTSQRLWTPGDFFDVQMEYETDLDG